MVRCERNTDPMVDSKPPTVGAFPVTAPLPLCPVVLSMLAARPRVPHEVAAELGTRGLTHGGYPAVHETLGRLEAAGLVRGRTRARGQRTFSATSRGRRELALQRLVLLRVAALQAATL